MWFYKCTNFFSTQNTEGISAGGSGQVKLYEDSFTFDGALDNVILLLKVHWW